MRVRTRIVYITCVAILSVVMWHYGMIANDDPARGSEVRYGAALTDLTKATTEIERWYALVDVAKECFNTGRFEDAGRYAGELERLAPKYKDNWNYPEAVHDSNMVQGLLGLRSGNKEYAKARLLMATDLPEGSMRGFGPNMSLARALLAAGEKEAVLEYFERCKRLWTNHDGRLDKWRRWSEWGLTPHFGANLVY